MPVSVPVSTSTPPTMSAAVTPAGLRLVLAIFTVSASAASSSRVMVTEPSSACSAR